MTGRYPHRMGMQTPFCGGMAEGLNLNETLLPAHLATAGYVSHAVGKASALFAVFCLLLHRGSFPFLFALLVAPWIRGLAFHANVQRL